MNLDRQNSGFGLACAHANTIHPGKYFGTTNKETMESYLCTWKEDGSELVYGVKVGGLTKRHFRDAALKLAMKAKSNDFTGLYHMESTRQGIRATLIS